LILDEGYSSFVELFLHGPVATVAFCPLQVVVILIKQNLVLDNMTLVFELVAEEVLPFGVLPHLLVLDDSDPDSVLSVDHVQRSPEAADVLRDLLDIVSEDLLLVETKLDFIISRNSFVAHYEEGDAVLEGSKDILDGASKRSEDSLDEDSAADQDSLKHVVFVEGVIRQTFESVRQLRQ